MTTFKEFVQIKALEDHLPFNINFEIKPDFSNDPKEVVAGFELPKFNELLSREVWFFELLGSLNSGKRNEVQMILRTLAVELKAKVGLEKLTDAFSALYQPTEEVLNNPAYEEFLLFNTDKLNKLTELTNLIQNDLALTWLKISFFMLSRYDGSWDMGKTASLRASQIKAISEFITLEANGGVIPEPVEATEEAAEEGKQSSEETGAISTGV